MAVAEEVAAASSASTGTPSASHSHFLSEAWSEGLGHPPVLAPRDEVENKGEASVTAAAAAAAVKADDTGLVAIGAISGTHEDSSGHPVTEFVQQHRAPSADDKAAAVSIQPPAAAAVTAPCLSPEGPAVSHAPSGQLPQLLPEHMSVVRGTGNGVSPHTSDPSEGILGSTDFLQSTSHAAPSNRMSVCLSAGCVFVLQLRRFRTRCWGARGTALHLPLSLLSPSPLQLILL